jgi:hypothetical protein
MKWEDIIIPMLPCRIQHHLHFIKLPISSCNKENAEGHVVGSPVINHDHMKCIGTDQGSTLAGAKHTSFPVFAVFLISATSFFSCKYPHTM